MTIFSNQRKFVLLLCRTQPELSEVSDLSSEDENEQDKGNIILRGKDESSTEFQSTGMESETKEEFTGFTGDVAQIQIIGQSNIFE